MGGAALHGGLESLFIAKNLLQNPKTHIIEQIDCSTLRRLQFTPVYIITGTYMYYRYRSLDLGENSTRITT
jgi:hypothetical protein